MWLNALLTLSLIIQIWARSDCSKAQYELCVRIADPLVKEAHLVFPDNENDIDLVCRTWNRFVDCLKSYTDNCFSENQRKTFNQAVESPIESVHQMCRQSDYQREYLKYAPCIKSTIVERAHCGPHYNLLVDQVSQGDIISKSTLCCSHDRFKQCVQRETRLLCDRGASDGQATRFATQIIDKALNFLQDQCLNYIPNSGDCTTPNTDTLSHSDPLLISTSSSEIYPWSTIQQDVEAKEILPTKIMPPKASTVANWLPSSSDSGSTADVLGSRTRPASYGRASSFSDGEYKNTVQMYPESGTTPSSRTDWATVTSWSTVDQNTNFVNGRNTEKGGQPSVTTTTAATTSQMWYPAAGNQMNNEVDEPNQLGLRKQRNGGTRRRFNVVFGLVLAIVWGLLLG